jgi:hypothetical protein
MVMRKITTGLALAGLALVSGCCHSRSNRCCPQPAVCGTAPVVRAAPAPCCNGAVQAGAPAGVVVAGQPPLGAQVPLPPAPCNGR